MTPPLIVHIAPAARPTLGRPIAPLDLTNFRLIISRAKRVAPSPVALVVRLAILAGERRPFTTLNRASVGSRKSHPISRIALLFPLAIVSLAPLTRIRRLPAIVNGAMRGLGRSLNKQRVAIFTPLQIVRVAQSARFNPLIASLDCAVTYRPSQFRLQIPSQGLRCYPGTSRSSPICA